MTDDTPQMNPHDYWSEVEADAATVVDHIQDDADEWDILAVDVAGEAEDGRILFLLVIRRKVSDSGDLILSERYYRFDVTDRDGGWLSNGIERRVNGSLATALRVLYSALVNGDLSDDDPMLMDSRGDGLEYNSEALTAPVRDLRRDDDSDDKPEGRDPRLKESATSGRTSQTVVCEECGGAVGRDGAINLGGALGVDMWVCDGEHVEGEDD